MDSNWVSLGEVSRIICRDEKYTTRRVEWSRARCGWLDWDWDWDWRDESESARMEKLGARPAYRVPAAMVGFGTVTTTVCSAIGRH